MASGLLYPILRPLAKIAIGIYFRKLHISNRASIPAKGPLIIACNHPNSFAEPCIFATYQHRTLHFIVRGDIFGNRIISWLLRQTNQIPIFRIRDGYSSLKRNDASFAACYDKLNQGEAILIFAEGLCIFEKRLRDLQKGTARMALGAYEQYSSMEGLHILPAGITFTHGDQYRGEVLLNIGEPISVDGYRALHKEDPTKAINELTQDLSMAIKPLLIHIDKPSRDILYDDLMDLMDSKAPYPFWPIVIPNNERFNREKSIEKNVNNWSEEKNREIQDKVNELKAHLPGNWKTFYPFRYLYIRVWVHLLFLAIGLIPAILGFIINALPFYAAKFIGSKFKKQIEFYTPVRMASTLLLVLLLNIILSVYAIWTSSYYLLIWSLSAPISGFIAVAFRENWHALTLFFQLKNKNRSEIERKRLELLKEIGLEEL